MSILKYKDPITGEFKRINPYKADLTFVGKDGITVNKATDSEEVEISGKGCVQRYSGPKGYRRAYITDETNWDTYTIIRQEGDNSANTLIQRKADGSGEIVMPETPVDLSITNKKYVEDNYVKKVKFTNLEQALNGYILDTTKEAYADLDSAVLKDSVTVGDNVYPIADKTRALVTRIEGKTTKMVQLLEKSTYLGTQTVSGITATNNGDGSWTINGTATKTGYINFSAALKSIVGGHKILICGNKENSNFKMGLLNQPIKDTGTGAIGIFNQSAEKFWGIEWANGAVINNVTITPQLFDLTAMNREDITTVEQFKAEFPELYPYENGNIYPAKISGVKFYENQDKSGEQASVTLPETYDLHGIGDYKDYLEITKNEDNELYTLKKVQSVEVDESEKTITPLATPVKTVIATNLTYEQVTAIRHNGGLIEVVDNANKGYARPTIKNTIVYRLTATNKAEV